MEQFENDSKSKDQMIVQQSAIITNLRNQVEQQRSAHQSDQIVIQRLKAEWEHERLEWENRQETQNEIIANLRNQLMKLKSKKQSQLIT